MSAALAATTTAAAAPSARAGASALCIHCGGAVPASLGPGEGFCCAGCAAAHALVERLGLAAYYLRRTLDPALRPPRPDPEAAPPEVGPYVRADADGTCRLDLMVDGLQCGACVWLIERALAAEPGVVQARVNLGSRRLALAWRGGAGRGDALAATVAALGYRPVPFDPARLDDAVERANAELLRALAVAGFAAANVMLLSVAVWSGQAGTMGQATQDLLHWFSALVALPAIVYAVRPFARSAWAALAHRRTNMDVPITVGVALATAMSLYETIAGGAHVYFDSACALLFFLLVGRYLDARARGHARRAAGQLLALSARAAVVLDADGTRRSVDPAAVPAGAVVLVAAGERIPVDGTIREGASDLDLGLITGESAPVAAGPGDRVFAGTLNLGGPLRIAATAAGPGTLLAAIARWMEEAERGRGRYVALADRVARRYAPVVHLLAASTFAGWMLLGGAAWQAALMNAVAVLIITCPCALALAVPAVQVVASGRLLRAGVLLKSGTALERLARVDTVVFDKTGTLTLGRLSLASEGIDPDALRVAAGIASASRHPLARTMAHACSDAVPALGVVEIPGAGLQQGAIRLGSRAFCGVPEDGSAGPELWLARPGRAHVRFPFADAVRTDAAATAAALRGMGLAVQMLSGDRPATAQAVAKACGIAEVHAGVDPAGKLAHIARLRAAGRNVLMVGDGLNDAPALAAADVSLSPTSASEISQNAADAVFHGERLAPVALALGVARRARVLVVQNLGFALLYNALAVPLAVAGLITPLVAAAAMSSSSLVVVLNALRAGRVR